MIEINIEFSTYNKNFIFYIYIYIYIYIRFSKIKIHRLFWWWGIGLLACYICVFCTKQSFTHESHCLINAFNHLFGNVQT